MPIRILLADDEPQYSQLIRSYLDAPGMEVIGEASDGLQALEKTLTLEPDVLLLDMTMPEMDGMQVLAAVKAARPNTKVIILTTREDERLLARAIALGAGSFITKQKDKLRNLPRIIRSIIEGEVAIVEKDLLSAALVEAKKQVADANLGENNQIEKLSEKERTVLKLISKGYNNKEIAENLYISPNTVKRHVSNVLRKLEVSDRTQAAVKAIRGHLLD